MHNFLKVLLLGTMLVSSSVMATPLDMMKESAGWVKEAVVKTGDQIGSGVKAVGGAISDTTTGAWNGAKNWVGGNHSPWGGYYDNVKAPASSNLTSPEFNYEKTYGQPASAAEWHPDTSSTGGAGAGGSVGAGGGGATAGGAGGGYTFQNGLTGTVKDVGNNSVTLTRNGVEYTVPKDALPQNVKVGDQTFIPDGAKTPNGALNPDASVGEVPGGVQAANAAEGTKGAASNSPSTPENGAFAPIEIFNVPQYILLIMEAKEGQKTDDATKEVTVKGAEPMQQSQGSQGGGASMAPLPSSEMAGTTIAGAASAMATLLSLGKIDLSLLSTDIEKPEEKERAPAVRASSSASQADVSASEVQTQSESQAQKMNTQEQREIMHRRALLLSEWAAAALQIGEGSNAISSDFYARAATFSAAASGAQGSMGGINTITDSDRFVLFELTRSAALSAVQLGLQGAENLNALDEVMEEPAPARTPGISASTSSSQ